MTEMGEYCKGIITDICDKIGPRPSCSEAARDAANYVKAELEKHCTEVETETFNGFPAFFRPFLGYSMISTLLFLVALVTYFLIPTLALILSILAVYVSVFKLFSMEELNIFYYLYPRRKGINVIGKIKPRSDPKKLVILGSHHDSPYYFPLYWKLKSRIIYYIYILLVFALIFFLVIIYKINAQLTGSTVSFMEYLIIIPIIGSGFMTIFGLFFISPYKTFGANDNLSAVSVCLGVAKSLAQNPLNATEVWLISFDAEESGMRGSKQFVKRRLELLKNRLTACINFDIVGVDDIILLPTKESMYRATHSPEVYETFKQAAENLKIPVVVKKQSFGGTDSAPFSRAHLKAASVLRLSKTGWPTVWHSKNDIPENIKEDKLDEMVKISLEFLSLIDSK